MRNAQELQADIKTLKQVLEKMRGQLLDRSRRNRLINYKESARDVAIIDEMPDQVYEHLVLSKKSFDFLDYEEDSADAKLFPLPENENSEPDRTLPISEHHDRCVAGRYTDDSLQTS